MRQEEGKFLSALELPAKEKIRAVKNASIKCSESDSQLELLQVGEYNSGRE